MPCYDEGSLFEMLILEGAQAGLSWLTVLRRRDGYRRAFEGFDPVKIAAYGPERVARLLQDPGIIRNRLKVESTLGNARAWLALKDEQGSCVDFLWGFVDGEPMVNRWRDFEQVPVTTAASDAMSRALKQRGFKFVGSTICYAYMQAVGMVDDHTSGCFRCASE